jgi:transposase
LESVQEEPDGPWLIKLDTSKIRKLRAEIAVNKNIIHAKRSDDLRRKVVRAYENGAGTHRELAKQYGVSESFVTVTLRKYRKIGSAAFKSSRTQPSVGRVAEQLIRRTLKKQPGIKLAALQEVIKKKLGLSFSLELLGRTLTRYGFPRNTLKPKPVYAVKKAS